MTLKIEKKKMETTWSDRDKIVKLTQLQLKKKRRVSRKFLLKDFIQRKKELSPFSSKLRNTFLSSVQYIQCDTYTTLNYTYMCILDTVTRAQQP